MDEIVVVGVDTLELEEDEVELLTLELVEVELLTLVLELSLIHI